MTKMEQSKEYVVDELRNKISQILSIPISTIESSTSFWELFPPNPSSREEAKEVTAFCEYISEHYMVYLTEREWEASTLSKLAHHIIKKQSNPEKMLKQIKKEQKYRKKWTLIMSLVFAFMLIGVFILCAGDLERKIVVTFGFGIFLYGILGLLLYQDNKKFIRETKWLRKL